MPITKYIYDDLGNVIMETDEFGVTQKTYTRTPDGDLLSEFDGTSTKCYEPDALGSTDALTDDTQTVTDRWSYRAFGAAMQTEGTDDTAYLFVGRQGYQFDNETGLYLLGNRYYDPNTGTFLSPDPIGFAGGDPNLYRYVGNNPVNAVDPTGLQPPPIVVPPRIRPIGTAPPPALPPVPGIRPIPLQPGARPVGGSSAPPVPPAPITQPPGIRAVPFPPGSLPPPMHNPPGAEIHFDCDICTRLYDKVVDQLERSARKYNLAKLDCLFASAVVARKLCAFECGDNPSDPSHTDPKAGVDAFKEAWKKAEKECGRVGNLGLPIGK
jgi:RHS repeat-associated protein